MQISIFLIPSYLVVYAISIITFSILIVVLLIRNYRLKNLLLENSLRSDGLKRELDHRVRNNFQVVLSLLSSHVREAKLSPNLLSFEKAKKRIKSLALVNECLYEQNNIHNIELSTFIKSLSKLLNSNFHCLLENEIDENNQMSMDNLIVLGMIICEVIEQIADYNDSRKPSVQLSLLSNEQTQLKIIGSELGKQKMLNQNFNSNIPKYFNALVRKLKAQYLIVNNIDFCFQLDLQNQKNK